MKHITWMVGGQQGDGFSSSGETFALGLNRMGYHIYGYFTNSSRIKGGHANYRVRISSEPRLANADELDILVAFDEETVQLNAPKLRQGGIVMVDEGMKVELPSDTSLELIRVPIYKIAEELGSKLIKNMVSVGASAALVGVEPEVFTELMVQRFSRKGDKVVAMNVQAIQKGYEYVKTHYKVDESFRLEPVQKVKRMLMTGNDAIGLGTMAAGCRTMFAYPITPATDIMEYLVKKLPKVGGIVLQTEDEIAAINMVIGSAYAGARSMTATSGPGLALMMEAIGLSGMTETPVVIVNTQRGGPSTGLPTKHEQSDLNASLYGTHGEIPKIVLAPSTAEECYHDTIQAFNLAEMYQCPVILMTDLALSQATQTVNYIRPVQPKIERGKLLGLNEDSVENDSVVENEDRFKLFKRYELTEDGVSPRPIPGTDGHLHHVTGVEHSEVGRPSEDTSNRQLMMDKRMRKLASMNLPDAVDIQGDKDSDLLIIGWGSSRGVIDEAKERWLEEMPDTKISHAHVKLLMPFPAEDLQSYVKQAKNILVVENNATGQLAGLIRQHVGGADKMETLLKYNGEPFYPLEIETKLKEMIEWQPSKTSVMI
jgi:2-oxoglutarate ferredoxin oxidoreductase subunit alpha